jgi:hypothetical protein
MAMRLVLGAWTIAMCVACRGTTAPPAFAGRYHLTAFDGVPVPTHVAAAIEMQSGWLRLDAGGDWMLSRTQQADAVPGISSVDTLAGRWTSSGTDITLYFASTSVVQATATYAPGVVVVTFGSNRYTFVPD